MTKQISIIIACLLLSLLFTNSELTLAQTQDQAKCEERIYLSEWNTLMYSFFDYHKVFDFFEDAFYKFTFYGNGCWWTDLEEVRRRETGIQEGLRRAFYACDNAKITKIKTDYYKVVAEKEFLRSVIDKDEGRKKLTMKTKEQIAPALRDYLVNDKNWLTEEQLAGYVDDFYLVYQDRFDNSYNTEECANPGWAELKKRWEQFKEDIQNLGGATKELEKQKKKMAARQARYEEEARQANEAKEAAGDKGGGFFKKHLGFSINKINPLKAGQKIWEEFKQNVPSPYSQTLSGVGQALKEEQKRYQEDTESATFDSEYRVMYQEAGAEIAATFVNLMKQTINVVNQSTTELKALRACADVPLEKQCAK